MSLKNPTNNALIFEDSIEGRQLAYSEQYFRFLFNCLLIRIYAVVSWWLRVKLYKRFSVLFYM